MRKRIIMGVAGASLILVGIFAGFIVSGGIPVFASRNSDTAASVSQATPGNATSYCQLYEQTLAKQLGVNESKLESANSARSRRSLSKWPKTVRLLRSKRPNFCGRCRHMVHSHART